jgi:hypothetical protein
MFFRTQWGVFSTPRILCSLGIYFLRFFCSARELLQQTRFVFSSRFCCCCFFGVVCMSSACVDLYCYRTLGMCFVCVFVFVFWGSLLAFL